MAFKRADQDIVYGVEAVIACHELDTNLAMNQRANDEPAEECTRGWWMPCYRYVCRLRTSR